jgi:Ca-activated chloride channel family protein
MWVTFRAVRIFVVVVATALGPAAARACETALLLAIDVSNSVDVGEYRLQVDGMADALLDPEIVDALLQGQVTLSVMQWSGENDQRISLPWTQMRTEADVFAFSKAARNLKRDFIQSNTAPGNAIRFALDQFSAVGHCNRHVIDVSGDGAANAGSGTAAARRDAERRGVMINGIAIESLGVSITQFYLRNVVTQYGFVITARRHTDYPRAIREKIIRELSRVTG